jgi:putative tryptophan/tyrosine transport system substrate-binding protein
MRRREFITLLGGAAAWPIAAEAQVTSSTPLIGFLGPGSKTTSGRFYDGFFEGMRELGYQLGRDYRFEDRYADGDPGRLPSLAKELVLLKPSVVVTGTSTGALAAKQATNNIPIVAVTLTDPVGMGLVASEAHPNTNVTGTLIRLAGMTGKQLEIGLDLVPGAKKVGILTNPKNPANTVQQKELKSVASTQGVNFTIIQVSNSDDLASAFQEFGREHIDIVLVMADATFVAARRLIATLALVARLPTVFNLREHVEAGGLVSYGTDLRENFRRAAYFVDRILKGDKPADLPIEFLPKVELVINLTTAKALGLSVPQMLLATADEVIE